jgi:DNA polymerase III delta prime subunit
VNNNRNDFIWSQLYRPSTIEECILPESIKNVFRGFIAQGQTGNLLLAGGPGVGKTTIAYALANELQADVLFINCSLDTGVDTVRTKLQQFASTNSFSGNIKICILDEIERMSAAAQDSLKSFIEIFSQSTRFILTTNNQNKIISPIISRCTTIDFKFEAKDKPKLASQFFKRLKTILEENNVETDQKVLQTIVLKYFPDFRRTLNELQRYASQGSIVDVGILTSLSNDSIDELIEALKSKDFTKSRKWVAQHTDGEPSALYRAIFNKAITDMRQESFPELILILAKYGYQAALVTDYEINNIACLVEIMSSTHWQ